MALGERDFHPHPLPIKGEREIEYVDGHGGASRWLPGGEDVERDASPPTALGFHGAVIR
jgi:hypothetical protein